MKVVIVGGSLTGLTFALACAQRGIRTCVLERVHGPHPGGGALGIDRDLLMRVIGIDPRDGDRDCAFPVLAGRRRAVTWQAIHDWLRGQALRHRDITLQGGVAVTEIVQNAHGAIASTADGQCFEGHLIVGADGYRSFVRRVINPEQPDAMYAGYLLWRGLIAEADLPLGRLVQTNDGIALVNKAGDRLVAYPVAGPSGSLAAGQRLISFAWYDARRHDLLRDLHCLDDNGGVIRSLAAENIPLSVSDELCGLARRIWPDPWRSAIIHALKHRQVFATPVADYFPPRLCRGSLAIIGDAAHVVSPVTGEGFVHGMWDAEELADCLASAGDGSGEEISVALMRYENKRLPQAQALVATSTAWGRAFSQKIPDNFSIKS